MYKTQIKSKKVPLSAVVLATVAIGSNAFTSCHHTSARNQLLCVPTPTKTIGKALFMASDNVGDEVAKLRAAAAKAREDAQRLAKEMGKEIDFSTTSSKASATSNTAKPKASPEEIKKVTNTLDFESGNNVALQASSLDELVDNGKFSMWKSAKRGSANTNSDTPLRTYPVSLEFLKSRSNGKLSSESLSVSAQQEITMEDFQQTTIFVVVTSTVLAIGSLALLPENIGSTLCYFFAIIPLIFLGIGSTAPGIIAAAIGLTKGTSIDKETKEDRICRHEAAHFLCGYVCGLPVIDYSITDNGFPCVEFYPTNTAADGNDNINTRELTSEEIATLSVVSMSGSVAEAITYDAAKGGENDLLQLNNYFRRCEEFLGAQKQQDLTRWGALVAFQILQGNKDVYENLITAFKERKSVNECIQIIES